MGAGPELTQLARLLGTVAQFCIDIRDQIEGDADLEDDDPPEETALERHGDGFVRSGGDDIEDGHDAEATDEDGGDINDEGHDEEPDREPSLGWGAGPEQIHLHSARSDGEAEQDDEPEDDDADEDSDPASQVDDDNGIADLAGAGEQGFGLNGYDGNSGAFDGGSGL